jgi:phosphoribosyl-ATP pyrophosphohydrolase
MAQPHVLDRLHQAVLARRGADPSSSRTAKLLAAGRAKMAQKLGEEAVEVAIDAARNGRGAVIAESADLLYHLVVLWADMGISPAEVFEEMRRRETAYGIAEKVPKPPAA